MVPSSIILEDDEGPGPHQGISPTDVSVNGPRG